MPTPTEIRAARKAAGLTQAQAAKLVGLSSRFRWAEYESESASNHQPDPARWMCFLLLTDQHPYWKLVRREKEQNA